jgi:hypothetical protein
MILLGLGLGALGLLLWAANAFSRASIASLKGLLAWVVALGGLALGTMLLLTGRGASAIAAGVFLGPLAWSWWQEAQGKERKPGSRQPGRGQVGRGRMGRAEALDVLGLTDPVSDSDVRAAWVRLMRVAHPDGGGTHGLAARVNQARDVLLKGQ